MCYQDVTRSLLTARAIPLGQQAHIVGRTTGDRSPRGEHPLPESERDEVDNLVLLCGRCHPDADNANNLDVVTVGVLRAAKRAHESRIEQILSIPPSNTTAILRLQGVIGDATVHIDASTAAATVLTSQRIASFPLSTDRAGLEIDLRSIATPTPANAEYYAACVRQIDRFFERQFFPAIEEGSIKHVSVFALARWPLLVHLGAALGNKVEAQIYQRHRASEAWEWAPGASGTEFEWSVDSGDDERDPVLVLSLSTTVKAAEIPASLQAGTTYRIAPAGNLMPHYDVVSTPGALKSAERAIRDVLADIEQHRKHARRLHVIGAAPLSVCVSLGRAITRGIHPQLVLYDRVEGSYQPTLEVS
ncbi:MAG: SAVED domain-containing protein [Ilumatobacteraceae bacterium]